MADDIVVVLVWADEGGFGWAEEGDELAIESDSHVDGCRVIGDDELCSRDDGQQLGDGGRADTVGDVRVIFGRVRAAGRSSGVRRGRRR